MKPIQSMDHKHIVDYYKDWLNLIELYILECDSNDILNRGQVLLMEWIMLLELWMTWVKPCPKMSQTCGLLFVDHFINDIDGN